MERDDGWPPIMEQWRLLLRQQALDLRAALDDMVGGVPLSAHAQDIVRPVPR